MENFGYIMDGFTNVLIESSIDKTKNQSNIKNIMGFIKENNVLRTQYLFYNNILNKKETDFYKAMDYVKENISLINNFKSNEIKEYNRGLFSIVNKKYNKPTNPLYESLWYLSINKPNPSNMDKILDCRNMLANHILKNKNIEETKAITLVPNQVLLEVTLKKFQEKYPELTESDKALITLILESKEEDQKAYFNTIKKDCITYVNGLLKESVIEAKEKLLNVKEKLMEMEYTKEEFTSDILKITTLKKDLEN